MFYGTIGNYNLSDALINKVKNLSNFKTDIYKIKSVSSVKSIYGISDSETILSYRIVPKLLAKLEQGGTVFTDKCVYKRLPSGMLTSDYVTYGIAYEELVQYLPALGYSAKEQPQLVGGFQDKKDLSFWLTPMLGAESNQEIVDLFWEIIIELINGNPEKKIEFSKTQERFLTHCQEFYATYECIAGSDVELIKQLIKRELISPELKEQAVLLEFSNRMSATRYKSAFDYLEENCAGTGLSVSTEAVSSLIRKAIENIGDVETYSDADNFKLFCEKDETYINELFPKILIFYINACSYDDLDEFINSYEGKDCYNIMRTMVLTKIEELLPEKIADWENNIDSLVDEELIVYSIKQEKFYKQAAHAFIKHYCVLGNFDEAKAKLEIVKNIKNDSDYIKELEEFISGYTVVYAADQYKKAQEYLNDGCRSEALSCLKQSVKYDSTNQEYTLCLIKMEIEDANYKQAKKDIEVVLKGNAEFDEAGCEQLHNLEVECAEGINQEMGAFYDLLLSGNADSLTKDSNALAKKDQMGLSFYHYAILLNKNTVVSNIDVTGTDAINDVYGYDLYSFAVGEEDANQSFMALIANYDDDAKKLLKDYKRKKGFNTAKEIGAGILGALVDSAISSASNADYRLREMESDSAYSSYSDQIADKRSQYQDARDQFKGMRESINGYSESNTESSDALYDEYLDNLIALTMDRYKEYKRKIRFIVTDESFQKKLIYLLITNPKLLEEIFHGDRENFALHEADGCFWYLPESIIVDANNLSVE